MNTTELTSNLVSAIQVVKDATAETKLRLNSDDFSKFCISVFIQINQSSPGGKGGYKKTYEKKPDNQPATTKQLDFLRKHGGKNVILANLTKSKAFEMIKKVREGWKK